MFEISRTEKMLDQNGIKTSIRVLCIGSIGMVHGSVRKNFRQLGISDDVAKSRIKWCSESNMICGNMIWQKICRLMHK